MFKRRYLLWASIVFLLAGCYIDPEVPVSDRIPKEARGPTSEQSKEMAEAINAFGFDLLRQLNQEMVAESQPVSPLKVPADEIPAANQQGENIFISPLSLSLVLQLANNGATGVTAEEIATVLHLNGLPQDVSNQASLELQTSLSSEPSVELLIANSAWIRKPYAFLPGYVQTAQTYFDAEVTTFSGPDDVMRINRWVSENTEEMITKLIAEITPNDLFFLLNAVYFKGDWKTAFLQENTIDYVFRLQDGTEKVMPFMHQTSHIPHFYGQDFDAAALPYKFDNMQMVILLPHEEYSLAELVDRLTTDEWRAVLDDLEPHKIDVALPRFQFEYETKLNRALMKMGMRAAFASLDFERLVGGGGTKVSYVKHKAVIKVNEEGTVAAAASAVVGPTSAPPPFTVDRPFFFAIHDKETGAVLFMGAAYEPETLED